MANLTDNKANTKAEAGQRLIVPDVTLKTAIQMWQGGALFRNPADSGLLVTDPATSAMLDAYGVAATNQLGDGLRAALLGVGSYEFDNSGTSGETIPSYFPLGWPVYAKDNQTVSMIDGSGTYPKLGHFGGFAKSGKPLVWVGFCPYAKDEITITRSIGHAELTDADTAQTFDLYALPGPAVMMGPPWIRSKTDFSGGGTGSATLAIGIGADVDALGDERDVFTGSAAAPAAMTAGVNGAAGYPLAATSVINLTMVADTTVAAFTAGVAVVSLRLKLGSY